VTYTYDGDLSRVKKSSGKLYWYGADGNALAETDLSGNITAEFIYFAGRRIAWRNGAGAVYYIYSDHLGSLRAMTNATGVLQKDSDYYPYGGERQVTNIVDLNYKFAGMEYDPETAEYHTLSRQYASNLGRWASPDPVRGSVDFPQGQNLYAYVLNNPTNLTDPLGLNGGSWWPWPCFTWFGCPPAPCPGPPPYIPGAPYPPGGGGGGATGTCTERTHLPGPIYGYPAGGNLCAGTDHPYFWWAWTCTGDYYCCLGKQDIASRQCEKEGGVGGGLVNNLLIPNYSATYQYANCCGRKPRRAPPPPGRPPRPGPG
jgi:RHS repeat-associated protein